MSSPFKPLALHAVVALFYGALLHLVWMGDPGVAAENHLMENLQAAALFGALLLASACLLLCRAHSGTYLDWGLAAFFFTALLRELEVKELGLPGWLTLLGSGTGKYVLLGVLWATVALLLLRNRRRLWADAVGCLRSPLGYYLLAALTFFLIGDVFDKKLLPLSRAEQVFWEEAAECLGTLWCLLGMVPWTAAAWRRCRAPGAGRSPAETDGR
jgi:hypothetical protein